MIHSKHLPDDDELISAEKSVFRTRMPRPVSSSRHIVILIMCCGIALATAIYFAEKTSQASMTKKAELGEGL